MNEHQLLIEQLERLWRDDFPLTRAMGLQVQDFTDHTLTVRAALSPNTNTHGTAFAGSLYAIEALCAWSVLHLELQLAGLDASIIHASGTIDFHRTIREDIVAQCRFDEVEAVMARLAETGKARLELSTQVNAEGELASRFTGLYAVRIAR